MNMRIIEEISNFIFIEDELKKADAIFIPGGSYPELPEKAAALWKEGYADILVPAGAYSIKTGRFAGAKSQKERYDGDYSTECAFYADVLIKNGVAPGKILWEDKSQCTADNARFTKRLLDSHGVFPKRAIICCKGFHARRCLMFYQFYFPETEFLIAPVTDTPGLSIARDNWYRTDLGLSRVLGELAKAGTQFVPEFERLKETLTD